MNLPKIKFAKKRLGRGYGSGKGGHTSSRGQKGQKTRRKIGILFEGLKMKKSFVKRLPFMRGKAKFKASPKPVVLNLEALNKLPNDVKVISIETLIKNEMINEDTVKTSGIKILGKGNLDRKFEFKVPVSGAALKKIENAGGVIVK